MNYVGLDLHKNFSQAVVVDQEGNVLSEKRLYNDHYTLERFFAKLPKNTPVIMEATRNWYWISDLAEEMGLRPILAHPKKVRIMADLGKKTDKIDARLLANLERKDILHTVYLPPRETRDVRELLRYRIALVRMRTSIKNRVHSILAKRGINHPFSDIFKGAGLIFLQNIVLPEIYRDEIDGYIKLLKEIEELIKSTEKKIRKYVKEEKEEARLLMSIPGISYFSALLLAVEIGEIERFSSYRKLCSYGGVVATTKGSGDKIYHGRINKDSNKYIRWCLIEAVPHAVLKDPKLSFFYDRITRKKGKTKAKIAIARKLLITIYYMLNRREEYKVKGVRENKYKKKGSDMRVSPGNILATRG